MYFIENEHGIVSHSAEYPVEVDGVLYSDSICDPILFDTEDEAEGYAEEKGIDYEIKMY